MGRCFGQDQFIGVASTFANDCVTVGFGNNHRTFVIIHNRDIDLNRNCTRELAARLVGRHAQLYSLTFTVLVQRIVEGRKDKLLRHIPIARIKREARLVVSEITIFRQRWRHSHNFARHWFTRKNQINRNSAAAFDNFQLSDIASHQNIRFVVVLNRDFDVANQHILNRSRIRKQ